MKTIYSILYVNLNTTLNERVSIGVIISKGEKAQFKFSSSKLSALKLLLNSEKYSVIKTYLKSIDKEISSNQTKESTMLFSNKGSSLEWISENYLNYLSKYSNNIIQFSAPKVIDVDFNENNFKRIFEKYVFRYAEDFSISNEINVHSIVKKQLFPKIENRVNIEKKLTANDFENLFAPIELDFIGLNGVPVAGQTIDFDKSHYYLENDVTRFVSLTKAIELEGTSRGKYFVVGREPKKNVFKNHQLWEHIRDTEFLEFVDIGEVGIIEDYIEKNNVRPFFE